MNKNVRTMLAVGLISMLAGCATIEAGVRVSIGPQSRGYQQQRAPSGGQYRPQSRSYQQQGLVEGRCRQQPDGRWMRLVQGVPDECPPPQNRR